MKKYSLTRLQCVQNYIAAMHAEIEGLKQYRETESWNTEECNCKNCQALEVWSNMTFFQRLRGKLDF
jgi:hypothetical protein